MSSDVDAADGAGDPRHDLRGALLVHDPRVGVEDGEQARDLGRAGGETGPARGHGEDVHAYARGLLGDHRVVFKRGGEVLLYDAGAHVVRADRGHPLHVGAHVRGDDGIHVGVEVIGGDGSRGFVDRLDRRLRRGGGERGQRARDGGGGFEEGATVHFFPLPLILPAPPGVSGKSGVSMCAVVTRSARRAARSGCAGARFFVSPGSADRS